MKKVVFLIFLIVIFLTGCTKGDKEIIVNNVESCKFSKKLVMSDGKIKYYTSCLEFVRVKYSVDSKEVSLFDELKNKNITMDEIYDRSIDIKSEDNMDIYEFEDYYILKCENNIIFGNIDNGVDKKYCAINNEEVVSLSEIANDYSYKDAISDSYYVITEDKVYNSDVLEHFLDSFSERKTAFIRIFSSLYENENTIIDVLYDNDGILVFVDNTRNKGIDNGKISTYNFTKLGIFEDEVGKYLYAYNGNVIDSNSTDSFLITRIIINE